MRTRLAATAWLAMAALTPVAAHHSFAAEFDDTKCEDNNRCPGGKCVK